MSGDFGPDGHDHYASMRDLDAYIHDADDARAERDQQRREAAADARDMRDNGWDAAGERAAANEEETA